MGELRIEEEKEELEQSDEDSAPKAQLQAKQAKFN